MIISIVNTSTWYPKGGNKAQIVPYAISKLLTLIPKEKDIDWRMIWQKQRLTPEMAEELNRLAFFTHKYLEREANGGLVRSMSRLESTWKKFQNETYTLSETFINSLVSINERIVDENQAKRAHRFNLQIDTSVEIFNAGADYWMTVYSQLSKEDILNWGELNFIQGISKYIQRGNLPTPAQCKRLIKIITKAEDLGYIMPQ